MIDFEETEFIPRDTYSARKITGLDEYKTFLREQLSDEDIERIMDSCMKDMKKKK